MVHNFKPDTSNLDLQNLSFKVNLKIDKHFSSLKIKFLLPSSGKQSKHKTIK